MFDSGPVAKSDSGAMAAVLVSPVPLAPSTTRVFEKQLNGSWELVLSLADVTPAQVSNFRYVRTLPFVFLDTFRLGLGLDV